MELSLFHVDAFTEEIFQGNAAAVCLLDEFLPDMLMQAIAGEMNLSETAFIVAKGDDYRIRWFTPTKEVKLCGHATLAAAHVLFQHYQHAKPQVRFHSLSGWLTATKLEQGIELDFPVNSSKPLPMTSQITAALGGAPVAAEAADDLMVVYSDATEIAILEPDFRALRTLPYRGFIATAPSAENDYDFVCRFFAPAFGIDEDPVTGSAYTVLAPYYAKTLGKTQFRARQLSRRGGNLWVNLEGDRVKIAGNALTVMQSTLYLPDRKFA